VFLFVFVNFLVVMPNPKNLDFAVSQVQESLGLANMLDPKNLDLTISQTQGNVGLANMLDPKNLDLVVSQVHRNMGLTNMLGQRAWTLPSFKAIYLILDDLLQYKY
jgi:hypothetical protein